MTSQVFEMRALHPNVTPSIRFPQQPECEQTLGQEEQRRN